MAKSEQEDIYGNVVDKCECQGNPLTRSSRRINLKTRRENFFLHYINLDSEISYLVLFPQYSICYE